MRPFVYLVAFFFPLRLVAAEPAGGLPKEAIDEMVRAHMKEISACYRRELKADPKLAGRISTRFLIGAEGRVGSASVTSSTLPKPSMENCVLGVIRSFQFAPPLGGGTVDVDYPFVFTPGEAAKPLSKPTAKDTIPSP